jgi:hypothetical protein
MVVVEEALLGGWNQTRKAPWAAEAVTILVVSNWFVFLPPSHQNPVKRKDNRRRGQRKLMSPTLPRQGER